jgi:type II secretory pathway component GspD/PulD (secretin)
MHQRKRNRATNRKKMQPEASTRPHGYHAGGEFRYEALNGRSFYDQKETRVATLRYADATRVANMLGPIKSAAGIVVADPATGSLILVDTPAKIAEMAF